MNTSIEKVIKEFYSWFQNNKYEEKCMCCLSENFLDNKNVLYIDNIHVNVEHRRKNIATSIMNKLIELSDDNELFIYLEISEYSEINSDVLRNFYSLYDFEPSELVGDYGEIFFRKYKNFIPEFSI